MSAQGEVSITAADIELIEREIPGLRRYARALTRDPDAADDLVQDSLERAISRIDRFVPGTDLRSWMFTIMHNLHVDDCRRRHRRGIHVPVDEWASDLQVPPPQPWSIEVRNLIDGFDRLRRSEQTILLLVGVRGLRYDEAADALGVAEGTVKSRLCRARESLRRICRGADA